jgi:signal transduction histidine kinase
MDEDVEAPTGLNSAQLRRINRLATSARMVAGLAHELNNALQVVSGLVELLGDRTDLPPEALTRIQKIGGQADKATAAIRQVVTYTRETGQETGVVNLSGVVEQALALRRYNLGRAGIVATVDLPAAPVTVTGDSRALLQMLLNLILNAEEALASQPTRELRLAVGRENGAIQVAVIDTGHGVSADLRARIFEPFFTTRQSERAVGLGLPVARALAGQSGGALTLNDAGPGVTTFVVRWPG